MTYYRCWKRKRSYLGMAVTVISFVFAFSPILFAQNWTNDEIDAWIDELEIGYWVALFSDDGVCTEILGSAAAGYGNVDSVRWNDQLIETRNANGITITAIGTGGMTIDIQIDPGSDNVPRTIIHEGMHASKRYTTSQVHGMQSEIQQCANDYMRH